MAICSKLVLKATANYVTRALSTIEPAVYGLVSCCLSWQLATDN